MKKFKLTLISLVVPFLLVPAFSQGQEGGKSQLEPPKKLHGKALKEKMASIRLIPGAANEPYQKLAPVWASKGSMKSTLKSIRKQAADWGADAVIDVRVKTEKLRSNYVDPGFWGGPYYGGWGPWGGPWGGMGYWGGYVQSHTYTQPVVYGWAVKWTGSPPPEAKDELGNESLMDEVENAPSNN